jgi:hypothetical protein
MPEPGALEVMDAGDAVVVVGSYWNADEGSRPPGDKPPRQHRQSERDRASTVRDMRRVTA